MNTTQDLPLEPVATTRLSEEAVEQIKALIDKGVVKPGDKLPSERDLVNRLRIGRTSVREALRILETLQFIEIKPGIGAFIKDRSTQQDLRSHFSKWLAEHQQEKLDLLEVREALEPKAAGLAAKRISEEMVDKIFQTIEKMEYGARSQNIEAAVEADIEFHDFISQASQNAFLINLNDSINYALLEGRHAAFQDPNRILRSCEEHRRVAEAIRQRDPQAATKAMLDHIYNAKEAIRQLTSE